MDLESFLLLIQLKLKHSTPYFLYHVFDQHSQYCIILYINTVKVKSSTKKKIDEYVNKAPSRNVRFKLHRLKKHSFE